MNRLTDRFLRYTAIDTQSAQSAECASETGAAAPFPSTPGQLTLLKMLEAEMREMGLTEVSRDAHGYVFGTIPASVGSGTRNAEDDAPTLEELQSLPAIGLLAHVDTSPDVSGRGVHPQVVEDYNGGDIALGTSGLTLSPREFPALEELLGHTLITSDGTTLLGADDKAGVAIIMTAAERLMSADTPPHGRIRIGFTPDEEVGRGTDFFDVEGFGVAFAYTVDGGAEGELEWENFNAATARVTFRGRNIHPGEAFGRMVNAARMAAEFDVLLGADERPETTRGRDGFHHLVRIEGGVESATAEYLLRDFDRGGLERRKQRLVELANRLNEEYAMRENVSCSDPHWEEHLARADYISVTTTDSYYNMAEVLREHPEVVERARRAMQKVGVQPIERPIRGGTDGARLSFMGLPCPNIFTGGANFHSRHEYCSLTSMQKAVEVIVEVVSPAP